MKAVTVAELPMLPSGKPDYPAVRDRARASNTNEHSVVGLRELFADVLRIDAASIDPEASFVDLGGNSLSYVTMSVRLERALARLPSDWQRLPLRELEAMPKSPRRWRPWWGATLESSVALRAIAIFFIVGSHAEMFELWGGAHVLLGIAGYNFGRFCLTPVPRPDRVRHLRNTIAWIAGPSVAWVAIALMITDDYTPTNLLLANKFLGPHDSMTAGRLWFVEVLVWILVALAVLCWLPVMDRLERQRPFAVAVAFLAAGLALRYDILGLHLGQRRMVHGAGVLVLRGGLGRSQGIDNAAARGGDGRADRRPARLLRPHRTRNGGAGRVCPADLVARAALPARGHRCRRGYRGGVAVHLPHPLPGLPAVRRTSLLGVVASIVIGVLLTQLVSVLRSRLLRKSVGDTMSTSASHRGTGRLAFVR